MRHRALADLGEPDRRRVIELAALLRLADGLDRPHRQRVERVEVAIGQDTLTLRLTGEAPLTREVAGAEKKCDLIKLAFHRRVRAEAASPGATAPPVGAANPVG